MPGYRPFPYKGFGGGLNLRDGVDVVQEDQALDLLNVSFSTRGAVSERSGYAKLTALEGTNRYDSLAAFYKSDGTKQIVAGAGNRLEAISSAGTVLASLTTPTANPHYFQRFGGPTAEHLYIANGTDTVRRWTGAAFETPVYVGVTPTGKFLGVSSTDNRLVNARFNGSTAGNNPSTVRFSNEGDPTTFASDNYVDLLPGDGEEITGVASWRDVVVVFKQTKFFVFYGNTVDDDGSPIFNYRPVEAGVGLVAPRAKAVAEQGIYFLDRTGIYFTTGSQPARVSELVEPIFHGTPSVYYTSGTLNDGSLDQVTMVYYNEQLWMSFPAGTAAVNTRNLVFDPFEKWWTLYDIPAGPMIVFRPVSSDELIFGYSSGSKHLGRHVPGSYTADNMGETWINLALNPSVETNTTGYSGNHATITNPAGAGGYGSNLIRATNSDGLGNWGPILGSSAPFRPVVEPSTTYTARVLLVSPAPGRTYKLSISWFNSGGSFISSSDGNVVGTPGQISSVVATSPSNAASCQLVFFAQNGGALGEVMDSDGFMIVKGVYTGDYFDGSVGGGTWQGVAHASTSYLFVPAINGTAINAFWQGGWFGYGTNAVKTIREAKIAGSGLVTVSYFRDYRLNPSVTTSVELSSAGALWDAFTWDDGTLWGPAGSIQPKPIRKAVRGEVFSLRLSNSVLNRDFTVNRYTTHVREVRVPSVVKVN